ncbi:MAG: hypothetical protein NE330_20665 [Lentisphaeraceae bacterium]|nr:hypothetical protein [Lentisphaeraceae bacterium]
MKSLPILLFIYFLSTNTHFAQEQHKELFPIFNINLGITTEEEIAKISKVPAQKIKTSKYYIVKGQRFWIKNGICEHLYLSRPSQLPLKWRNMNFSWYNSYNEWIDIITKLGFKIKIIDEPHVKDYRNKDSFFAKFEATKPGIVPLKLTFAFAYSFEITKDSEGTLHNLRIQTYEPVAIRPAN